MHSSENSSQALRNGYMIQLLNNKTHAYLISDKIHYQKGSKQMMVGGSPIESDHKNIWIVELYTQTPYSSTKLLKVQVVDRSNEEIWYGDLVTLRNLANNAYLTISSEHKCQTSKNKESSGVLIINHEDPEPQYLFTLARNSEIFPLNKFKDCSIKYENQVRLISASNLNFLSNHQEQYHQKDIGEYKEVYGTHQLEEGIQWTIKLNGSCKNTHIKRLDSGKPQQKISDKSFLMIINAQNGCSLHSHQRKIKGGSKEHEVTGKAQKADQNDVFQIVIQKKENMMNSEDRRSSLQHNTVLLTQKSSFTLLHQQTNTLLCHIDGMKASTGTQGLEVCGSDKQQNQFEWEIESLMQEDEILQRHPILIKHKKTNHYLACTLKSSQYKYQYETLLIDQPTNEAIWYVISVDIN